MSNYKDYNVDLGNQTIEDTRSPYESDSDGASEPIIIVPDDQPIVVSAEPFESVAVEQIVPSSGNTDAQDGNGDIVVEAASGDLDAQLAAIFGDESEHSDEAIDLDAQLAALLGEDGGATDETADLDVRLATLVDDTASEQPAISPEPEQPIIAEQPSEPEVEQIVSVERSIEPGQTVVVEQPPESPITGPEIIVSPESEQRQEPVVRDSAEPITQSARPEQQKDSAATDEALAIIEQARLMMEQAQQAQMQAQQAQAQAQQNVSAAQQAAESEAARQAREMIQKAQKMMEQAQNAQFQAQQAAQQAQQAQMQAQMQAQQAAQQSAQNGRQSESSDAARLMMEQAQRMMEQAQNAQLQAQQAQMHTSAPYGGGDQYALKEVDRLKGELDSMRELVSKLTITMSQAPNAAQQSLGAQYGQPHDRDEYRRLETELDKMRREIFEKELRDREKEIERKQKEAETVREVKPEVVQMSESRDLAPFGVQQSGIGHDFIPMPNGMFYSPRDGRMYVMTPTSGVPAQPRSAPKAVHKKPLVRAHGPMGARPRPGMRRPAPGGPHRPRPSGHPHR